MSYQPSIEDLRDDLIVTPGDKVDLDDRATEADDLFPDKDDAKRSLKEDAYEIDELQDRLYAEKERGLLVVFQGIDTSGKDGTTKAVLARYLGRTLPRSLPYVFQSFRSLKSNEQASESIGRSIESIEKPMKSI